MQTTATPKTVLVVEDNETSMRLFQALIESLGHNALQATDANEALALARKCGPNLIIVDIQLPEVSGLVAAKWIKQDENLKAIPIIAVTALPGSEEAARQAGCEAYLDKPISVARFLMTVEKMLR
jgi:two-component system, cell cycle response regulator DivK